ncbi:MAG: hypothetical protein A2854_02205 [Parcubacteria group bacterium RIFCSPHIGHO2_01_FULL_56_18]|nr:MAG: hypothetical protein A2854_02205 [Parcubacteria group bacterium RIFCSPHIGHO2_01_FULL_56_18]
MRPAHADPWPREQQRHLPREFIRAHPHIIVIDPGDKLSLRCRNPAVQRGRQAQVRLAAHILDSCVAPRVNDLPHTINARIVNDYDLNILIGLGKNAIQRLGNKTRPVVSRHHH